MKTDQKINSKDIIHFYIGCSVVTKDENFNSRGLKLIGISDEGCKVSDEAIKISYYVKTEDVKLCLRLLSDMTDEEYTHLGFTETGIKFTKSEESELFDLLTPIEFAYLLKQGFDLFELIKSNQAVEKVESEKNDK